MHCNIMAHTTTIRIYYEDTDSGGVVYYANYLKFAERARTEMLRGLGINQSTLVKNSGIVFVVKKATLELLAPARLDDIITIQTSVQEISGASINILQEMECNNLKIAKLGVLVVCVNDKFKPARIPDVIKKALGSCILG